jgi:hypothetical protein
MMEYGKFKPLDDILTDIIHHIRLGHYDDREARQRIKFWFGEDPREVECQCWGLNPMLYMTNPRRCPICKREVPYK